MSKKIMILGASILQLPAIRKAAEMGLCAVVVDRNPNAVGFSEPGIVKEVVSTVDIPGVVEAAKRNHVDGVMTLATDMPMRAVAAVAKELGLVGVSDDTAVKATNKWEMRKALRAHHVPVPDFFCVTDQIKYEEAVNHFLSEKIACIVKPVDNSGSRGTFKLNADSTGEEIKRAFLYSKQFSRSGDVMVEEWMEGPEVSVETLTVNGEFHVLQITDKLTTGAPHFVEMGHSQPTQLPPDVAEQIRRVAEAANRALGIENGPSHTEIIVTRDGPKIVELGARMGGDCITTHLVPLSTGIDMVECCIRIALGETPDITPKFEKGAAIRYFRQTAGKVYAIEGIDRAEKMPGVTGITVVHGVGETVTEVVNSTARMGFVIADGASAAEAVAHCEAALGEITLQIVPRRFFIEWRQLVGKWSDLPDFLQKEEIRPYFERLQKRRYALVCKRIFDIVMSGLMLLILSPAFLLLALAIKLDSPGPVFFRQIRVTQYGKLFRIYKFRTMTQNAEKTGSAVTVAGDARITRVGKIIRKFRLDEISQLIDVFRGTMSFVGTRPEVPKYVKKYNNEMLATLLLPAGVTSLASIKFKDEDKLLKAAEDVDACYLEKVLPKKMDYNLQEIRNFSFRRDLKLCFMTVLAVLGKNY